MSSRSNEKLYFSIAGFCICLFFYSDVSGKRMALEFKNWLKRKYSGFVLENTDHPIDYKVLFEFKLRYEFIQNKSRRFIIHYEYSGKKEITTFYHISELQFSLILRDICQQLLAKNDGFLIHGSASLIHTQAAVFLGQSGAGKSTCAQILSLKYQKLADDILILRKIKKKYFFFQTPFQEKNSNYSKSSLKIPLGNIYLLKKSKKFSVVKEEKTGVLLEKILPQLFTEPIYQTKQVKKMMKLVYEFDNIKWLHFALGNDNELIKLVSENR